MGINRRVSGRGLVSAVNYLAYSLVGTEAGLFDFVAQGRNGQSIKCVSVNRLLGMRLTAQGDLIIYCSEISLMKIENFILNFSTS